MRSSIETEPTDFTSIQSSYDDLKGGIDDFIKGVPLDSTSSSLTLKDGIKLLEKALAQFQAGDEKTAAATMKKFITIWPTIEGDVIQAFIRVWKVKHLLSWLREKKKLIRPNCKP